MLEYKGSESFYFCVPPSLTLIYIFLSFYIYLFIYNVASYFVFVRADCCVANVNVACGDVL